MHAPSQRPKTTPNRHDAQTWLLFGAIEIVMSAAIAAWMFAQGQWRYGLAALAAMVAITLLVRHKLRRARRR